VIGTDATHALAGIATALGRIADALERIAVPDAGQPDAVVVCQCGTWRTADMPHGDGCPVADTVRPQDPPDRKPGCLCEHPDVTGHTAFGCRYRPPSAGR